jgi:hypothetical protein
MQNTNRQRRTIRPVDVWEDTTVIIKLPDDVRQRLENQAGQGTFTGWTGRTSVFPVAIQAFFGHFFKIFGQTGRKTGQGAKHAGH